MAKKVFTDESLATFVDEIKAYTDDAVSGKADAHDHPYLSSSTKYALSDSVGGNALISNKMSVVGRVSSSNTILQAAAAAAVRTEEIWFGGSDGVAGGMPAAYCITVIKKGDNHRTLLDCYHLNTGNHYINGCMDTRDTTTYPWTGWVKQPNKTDIDTINAALNSSIKGLSVSGQTITYTKNDGTTGTITTQDTNTDTKVTNTLATTTKAYITGTTSATTNTGTQVFDTGVYLDTTAGQLVATTFKGNLDGEATSAARALTAEFAEKDTEGNYIVNTYETKTDASAKLDEAKAYADDAVSTKANTSDLGFVRVVSCSSDDGVAYTGTTDGITALTAGLTIVFIPSKTSASKSPTLDINGLGAKGIRRRLSHLSTTVQSGYANTWLFANKPFLLVYDGTQWIADGLTKPSAADLYGTPAAATKATQDGDGNVIVDTYATKTELEAVSDALEDEALPDYWEAYLPDKITAIKALQAAGGKDCFSFIVITDTHYTSNLGKRAPAIAKRIMDECDIRYAIALGDSQGSGSTATFESVRSEWDGINDMFKPIADRTLFQRGNHDGSWGTALADGTTYPYNFTPEELYALIQNKTYVQHDAVTDESGTGYYIDDVPHKVRYILLNTTCNEYVENADGSAKYNNMTHARYTQSQYDMLIEALTTVKSGWSVVVASHVPPNDAYADYFGGDTTEGDAVIMRGLLKAYKNKTSYTASWDGTAGGTSYTNLFDPSGAGFYNDGTNIYSNWIPYTSGTTYHIKGWEDNNASWANPYKMHFSDTADAAYSGGTGLMYCSNANVTAKTTADYDSSVRLIRHDTDYYTYIQFYFASQTNVDNIIITANEPIAEGGAGYDAVSVDVDFSDANGDLISYFAGHMHRDYLYSNTDYGFGFNIITTACDADLNTSVAHTEGTVTEQSFDVFTVNRKTGTIYATKIGAGEDREIDINA